MRVIKRHIRNLYRPRFGSAAFSSSRTFLPEPDCAALMDGGVDLESTATPSLAPSASTSSSSSVATGTIALPETPKAKPMKSPKAPRKSAASDVGLQFSPCAGRTDDLYFFAEIPSNAPPGLVDLFQRLNRAKTVYNLQLKANDKLGGGPEIVSGKASASPAIARSATFEADVAMASPAIARSTAFDADVAMTSPAIARSTAFDADVAMASPAIARSATFDANVAMASHNVLRQAARHVVDDAPIAVEADPYEDDDIVMDPRLTESDGEPDSDDEVVAGSSRSTLSHPSPARGKYSKHGKSLKRKKDQVNAAADKAAKEHKRLRTTGKTSGARPKMPAFDKRRLLHTLEGRGATY